MNIKSEFINNDNNMANLETLAILFKFVKIHKNNNKRGYSIFIFHSLAYLYFMNMLFQGLNFYEVVYFNFI